MNNFIWGNDRYQYYETICGGAERPLDVTVAARCTPT